MMISVPTVRWGTQVGIGALMNLGLGDCPAYAPYATEGGGCSNLPEGVDAHSYFQAGGQLDEESGTIVGWEGDSRQPALECPYGAEVNPFTGRTECRTATEAKYTTSSGYVLRAGSQADMAAIAAAAESEARARGIPVKCGAYAIGGDPITNEQRYAPGCTVGGAPIGGPDTFDAAAMLTGGGMETLATQLGINPFFKASTGYQFTPPTAQQQASMVTQKPNQSVPPRDTSVPLTTSIPRTADKIAGQTPVTDNTDLVTRFSDGAQTAVESLQQATGMGILPLLAIAGVALFMFSQRGGR